MQIPQLVVASILKFNNSFVFFLQHTIYSRNRDSCIESKQYNYWKSAGNYNQQSYCNDDKQTAFYEEIWVIILLSIFTRRKHAAADCTHI